MPFEILVVEDNPVLRYLYSQQLQKLGVQCVCANNGAEAIEHYKQKQGYGLVIMDVMMPVLDGLEATAQIRDFEEAQNLNRVPIVGVTAVDDRKACLAVGMDDFYQKPLLPDQMKEIIQKWMIDKQA